MGFDRQAGSHFSLTGNDAGIVTARPISANARVIWPPRRFAPPAGTTSALVVTSVESGRVRTPSCSA